MNYELHRLVADLLKRRNGQNISVGEIGNALQQVCPKPNAYDLWGVTSLLSSPQECVEEPQKSADPFLDLVSDAAHWDVLRPLSPTVTDFIQEYIQPTPTRRVLVAGSSDIPGVCRIFQSLRSTEEMLIIVDDDRTWWRVNYFKAFANSLLGWRKAISAKVIQWKGHNLGFFNFLGHDEADICNALSTVQGEWDAVLRLRNTNAALILESCRKLAPNGVALCDTLPAFFSPQSAASVYATLETFGFSFDAYLQPPGSKSGLGIFKRECQQPVFVGELQADPGRQAILLENLRRKRLGKEPALGLLVPKQSFRGFEVFKLTREYNLLKERSGLPTKQLAELALDMKGAKRTASAVFHDKPNAIYLPNVGLSPVVTSVEDFHLKPRSYIQIVLKPDLVNAAFLANLFNSETGIAARKMAMASSSKISIPRLRQDLEIPLPPLSIQAKALEADNRLSNLRTDTDNLRKRLWGKPEQAGKLAREIDHLNRTEALPEWIGTLPFPLASVLWGYHTARHDPKKQFEYLVNFFEALTEFHAAVLLTAARSDPQVWGAVRDLFHTQTERDNLHIETSTFGTWVEVAAFLSKRFRELWNQSAGRPQIKVESGPERCEAALRTTRQEVIDMLLSRTLINVHRKANSFRNNYRGHSGIMSEDITRSLLAELGELLATVRSHLGETWKQYHLVSATDRSVLLDERHRVVVHHLHGATLPFPTETLTVAAPLKGDSLYLIDRDYGTGLQLLPLVAIHDVNQPFAACYFYNRRQSDGSRYISYHFEAKPEVIREAKELTQLFTDILE